MNELLIVAYIISVVFAHGSYVAFFQREYSIIADETYVKDMCIGLFTSPLGPISIFATYCCGYRFKKHGLKFW